MFQHWFKMFNISSRCLTRSRLTTYGLRYFSRAGSASRVLYKLEQNIINPSYTSSKIPESLLAVSIQNNVITYLHMTREYEVKHWATLKLYDDNKARSSAKNTYQELVWEAVQLLPPANLYLMEDTSSPQAAGQTLSLSVALWQCRIETALTTLLNAQPSTDRQLTDNDSNESNEPSLEDDDQTDSGSTATVVVSPTGNFRHSVYKLKPAVVGRYFDLFVAGRRTSCSALAENIAERRGALDKRCSDVRVSLRAANNFRSESKRAVRDQMGYCLLEAIYFYNQLELIRTKSSMASK